MAGRKHTSRPPASRAPSRKLRLDTTATTTTTTGAAGRQKGVDTVSPTESIVSQATVPSQPRSPNGQRAGAKRKDREHEHDAETSIRVIVRCRGRNEREIKENEAVALSTNGVKGDSLELSMGPSALANKIYHFDRVFSPAADQSMIYDDVVMPMLDEVLSGFNCTVFAYGQTGTGKTYTMSGDMSDVSGMLSDSAGIIPRVLHSLFRMLEEDMREIAVKCSFIELYNEELRDLLATDDSARLKLYEDGSKKLHGGTYVQGMEETYVKRATEGIKLLQTGNEKRQVAATRCNELSSRSHTVFTVTVYVKRTADNGEEFVSAGKLNLVDLAGSENIQRSGAENKRAAEAGLINKSLLTLGRVINALVDRASHIPYRESKLTRLLQDSLGGHTKTCIIATVSPVKSNLEETISTLDYAFRAKNIRNKPQLNQLVSKNTLIRDFTLEIEKLKTELLATRQRNGIYLSNESYDQLTGESESRRILNEEHKAKIDLLEVNLRNKVQDLFTMTTSLSSLKKEHESLRLTLDTTTGQLAQTETILTETKRALEDESVLRRAHQQTEGELNEMGEGLISTLHQTVSDLDGLHSKLRRKSELSSRHRATWATSQVRVSDMTRQAQLKLRDFEAKQREYASKLSARLQEVVQAEHQNMEKNEAYLRAKQADLEARDAAIVESTGSAQRDMDDVLGIMRDVQQDIKYRVSTGLRDLSSAAEQIASGVKEELESFQSQLQSAFATLDDDIRTLFDQFAFLHESQRNEADDLRRELLAATTTATESHQSSSSKIERILAVEKQQADLDRESLLSQITALVNGSAEAQEARVTAQFTALKAEIDASNGALQAARVTYNEKMEVWSEKEADVATEHLNFREALDTQLQTIRKETVERCSAIQATAEDLHDEMVQVVEENLTDVLDRADDLHTLTGNARTLHHGNNTEATEQRRTLVESVADSYQRALKRIVENSTRARDLHSAMSNDVELLTSSIPTLEEDVHQPLERLRTDVTARCLEEYMPTGQTPRKTSYQFPTALPQTDSRENVLAAFKERGRLRTPRLQRRSSKKPPQQQQILANPDNADAMIIDSDENEIDRSENNITSHSLREVDVNVSAGLMTTSTVTGTLAMDSTTTAATATATAAAAPPNSLSAGPSSSFSKSTYGGTTRAGSGSMMPPPAKRRRMTTETRATPGPDKGKTPVVKVEGRENSAMATYNMRSSRKGNV